MVVAGEKCSVWGRILYCTEVNELILNWGIFFPFLAQTRVLDLQKRLTENLNLKKSVQ